MEIQSTVLIVDDNDFSREATEGLLAGEGYHLVMATNGPEAICEAKRIVP